jgi:hypothetical protein
MRSHGTFQLGWRGVEMVAEKAVPVFEKVNDNDDVDD